MNNQTTQRPTPETDAYAGDTGLMYAIYYEGKATSEVAPADFARKLERERDEAREQLESILGVIPADAPCLHTETGETVTDYILGLQKEVGRVHALYFNDKQQLKTMHEAIKEAHEALAELVNLGSLELPQRRDSALLAGSSAITKLQPFLK